jgi:hypothetical protein
MPDAVAVVADPLDHAGEEVADPLPLVALDVAEAEGVEHRDGAGAHGEDVAEDAAHPGGRALVGLDRRRGGCATRS